MSTPVLSLVEEFTPLTCVAHNCPEPPCATYVVVADGVLFGREMPAGHRFHVCDFHNDEAKAEVR
jgi:hypothetical protein